MEPKVQETSEPTDAQPATTGSEPQAQPTGAGTQTDAAPPLTPDQINAIVERRLAEDRAKRAAEIRDKYGNLDDLLDAKKKLTEQQEAELSENERLKKRLEEAEAEKQRLAEQKAAAELATLRLEVGQAAGLPPALASRLKGEDREALVAEAEELKAAALALAGNGTEPKRQPPNLNAGDGTGQPQSGSGVKLTPSQLAAARMSGKTPEQYAEALQKLAEAQKGKP